MNGQTTYDLMRQIADSWGLLAMLFLWLGFGLWAFRPGARQHHEDAAMMIFKDDHDGE